MCLEFILSDLLQEFETLFLSVKHIVMKTNLSPNSWILLIQIHIFLSQKCMNSTFLLFKIFVRNVLHGFSLFKKMLVYGTWTIFTAFLRRLDQEPNSDTVSLFCVSMSNCIPKLLLSSKIIEERLSHEIQNNSVAKIFFNIILNQSILIVSKDAAVLVLVIF